MKTITINRREEVDITNKQAKEIVIDYLRDMIDSEDHKLLLGNDGVYWTWYWECGHHREVTEDRVATEEEVLAHKLIQVLEKK